MFYGIHFFFFNISKEIYVNLPPVPPPTARDKINKVPPPRPAKSSTLQQSHQAQNGFRNPNSPPFPIVLQQHHFSNTDGYVGLALQATPSQQRNQHQRSPTNSNHIVVGGGDSTSSSQLQQPSSSSSFRHNGLFESTSSVSIALSSSTASIVNSRRHNVLDTQLNMQPSFNLPHPVTPKSPHTPLTPKTPNTHAFMHTPPPLPLQSSSSMPAPLTPSPLPHSSTTPHEQQHNHPDIEEIIEYSDAVDSIRRSIDRPDSLANAHPLHKINRLMSPSNENLLKHDQKFQKLSPEKYDQMVGNMASTSGGGACSSSTAAAIAAKDKLLQEHADDIELYVDPCDYASLKDIGLPMQEIKEMSAKLKQEQKDAVSLQ